MGSHSDLVWSGGRSVRTLVIVMPLASEQIATIRQLAPGWDVISGDGSISILPYLREAEIVAGWKEQVNLQMLPKMKNLRWVHALGSGVDSYPCAELGQRGIVLTNSSGVHAYPISETIFAMMLAFTRNINVYIRNQVIKRWDHGDLNIELHGKTIGLIGLGAIGEETVKLANAFGMKVLGLRRSDKSCPGVDEMYDRNALNVMLSRCHYVVNTLPLTPETYHFIGREQLAAMKPEAFYVNVGRGRTTDTAALVEALQQGRLAGAGLDVFEQEPLPEESPLWEMDNVIITPHSSGATASYYERALDIFMANLEKYMAGEELTANRIDLDRQY
ncbi:MAG: D-2-hydroxyacid dehydrogenase [Cohnella sp.]|nr:D-2-hydroxyacid dehydrogenase [Cohnella sp.]